MLSRIVDSERALGLLLVAPVVLLLAGLVAYPFSVAVYSALTDQTLAEAGRFIGFGNFVNLWDDQIYRQSLRNTLVFTVGSVTLKLCFGLGLALLLNEAFPFRRLVRAAILLPWIVPTVLGTMAWLWMFTPNFSVLNYVLAQTGISRTGVPWLTDPAIQEGHLVLSQLICGLVASAMLKAYSILPAALRGMASLSRIAALRGSRGSSSSVAVPTSFS